MNRLAGNLRPIRDSRQSYITEQSLYNVYCLNISKSEIKYSQYIKLNEHSPYGIKHHTKYQADTNKKHRTLNLRCYVKSHRKFTAI